MTPVEMRSLLESSFADRFVSRTERTALRQRLDDEKLDDQQLAKFRSIAFEIARGAVDAKNGSEIIDWLEEIVKSLHVPRVDRAADVSEVWFSPHDECAMRIRTLLARAKHSIDICVFTITDDRLTSAILDAHARGVKIRIISDNEKAGDVGSDADRFVAAGVAFRVDRSEYHMHHKFAIFDHTILLNGSYNWTRGASENNEENVSITNDTTLVSEFQKHFESMWKLFEQ